MSTFPVNPGGTRQRRGFNVTGMLVLLGVLCLVGYFIYNMAPNLVSSVLPGRSDGVSGEWVGLVKYKPTMMSSTEQPAALKVTLKPTDLTSIIPTYKMTAELHVAGHSMPVTLESDKLMTGHMIKSMNGQVDTSSEAGLKGGIISGDIKEKEMKIEVRGFTSGSDMSFEGTLQPGSDADYAAALKQLQ